MANEQRLIELLTEYFGVDPAYYGIEAQHLADHLIANGVVIPVRCKDCKYFMPKVDGTVGFCKCGEVCGYLTTMRVADDFCSYGERRTDA